MPTKADDPDAVLALAEFEHGGSLHVRPLRLPVAEDGRDADRSVELLCHNQSSHGGVCRKGALFNRLLPDVVHKGFLARVFRACAHEVDQERRPAVRDRRIASVAPRGSAASMIAETTATPATPCFAKRPAFSAVMPPIAKTGRRERFTTSSRRLSGRTGSSGFVGLGENGPTAR